MGDCGPGEAGGGAGSRVSSVCGWGCIFGFL